MIGYYAHHHGSGHVRRATALLGTFGEEMTILSSAPPPSGLRGVGERWLGLPLDVGPGAPPDPAAADVTAGGVLHWAPLGHDGLRARMAAVSAWIQHARPSVVVSDVSQEVALLCRLHGVPVVSVVLPGHRADLPHDLGLRASTALGGFWPAAATDMLTGVDAEVAARVVPLGALSRYPVRAARGPRRPGPPRLLVLGGGGGAAWTADQVAGLRVGAPGWEVEVAGPGGRWLDDPWPRLLDADVAVVQAGQNAIAEVAAARVPAVVVPGARPFDEQHHSAARLHAGPWPALALPRLVHPDWPRLLDGVRALDGADWATWNDGGAGGRFADLVRGIAA